MTWTEGERTRRELRFRDVVLGVGTRYLVVKTRSDPSALAGAVTREVQSLDAELPVYDVATMEERLADSLARRRFSMFLLVVFAACASLLAVIGIYGVVSFWVSQRTRELGMLRAVGMTRRQVRRMVRAESVITADHEQGFFESGIEPGEIGEESHALSDRTSSRKGDRAGAGVADDDAGPVDRGRDPVHRVADEDLGGELRRLVVVLEALPFVELGLELQGEGSVEGRCW